MVAVKHKADDQANQCDSGEAIAARVVMDGGMVHPMDADAVVEDVLELLELDLDLSRNSGLPRRLTKHERWRGGNGRLVSWRRNENAARQNAAVESEPTTTTTTTSKAH